MNKLDYFQMRAYLFPREVELMAEFKLSELEDLWFCTTKNVKRKIKQFEENGLVIYQPGKGRGNASHLTFMKSLQEEIEADVQALIQKDRLEDIVQIIQLPVPKSMFTNVFSQIQNLFGLKSMDESKDVLRTIITREVTTLDPLQTSINFETFLIHQLGDTLVSYNEKSDTVEPHLAHSWEINEDSTIWTFYLRRGVRFHNQNILTSEDVKFTFERFYEHNTFHKWLVEDIETIECPSPNIVLISLKSSNPFFLRYLSSHNLVILPKDEPISEDNWIGTGPFQLAKKTKSMLVLKAFDDYFLSRPLIDEVEFYRVAYNPSKGYSYEINKEETGEPITTPAVTVGFRFLAFNFNKETIVQNEYFREAIYHIFRVREMWNALGRKELKEASSYFYWKSKPSQKDFNKAKSLLDKSGYNGEVLTFYTVGNPSFMEEADWFIKEAAKLGVKIERKLYTLDQLYDPLVDQADLFVIGEVASTDLHLSFMGAFLNKALVNRFFSSEQTKQLEDLFIQMKQGKTKEQREQVIDLVEDYIRRENLLIYLYHPIKMRKFDPMIKDIEFESYGYIDFRKLWIK